MGFVTVPGLGVVKIAGDVPTQAEDQEMQRLLSLQTAPGPAPSQADFTPEDIESAGFGDLAQTMRGFQQLEEPAGREFWGDYEHPLQSEFVRPLAAGVSALPRGVLKGALAGAEVVAGRPYAPELVELEQSWADWERGLTKGAKPEDDDIYAVLGKASEGEVTPLLSLMTRGMVQATPGMIAAVQSMPAYMGTLIGDYAEQAAAERGSDSIEFNDLGRAIALAGAVAGTERASALKALSGAGASTVKGAVARGALIEGGEEYAQQHLENIAMQAGSDRPGFLGVDWEEGHKGGIHTAFVGGPMGALAGLGGAVSRRPPAEPTPVVEEVATPTAEERRIATGFSGTGTVEAALAGVRSVHAVEHDPKVVEQYNKAHGTSYKPRSIVDVDPAEIAAESPDVYHASPVCKNFSKAKRLRTADKGDVASAEAVSRVIREAEPPVVTVENVPAYKDTALFRLITDALDAKGYTWDVVEHDAADYGAPQSRKRMLLRAVREGSLPPLPPKVAPGDWYTAVEDLIADAPESTIPQWERDRIARMVKRGTLDITKPILTMGGSAGRGVAAAVNAGSPSKTLKATPKEVPRILMPDGTVKRVTPRMMARLMGLPDTFAIPDHHGLAKTVLGNGISGEVTRGLIQPLVDRSTPVVEEVTEEVVTPTEEVVAAADYAARPAPREQVEADTDVAVRRVEADKTLAEEIAAVPTRPRTGEAEPRTTQAQAQAELDQADVDVDTAASDPSASLADVVEKQARTAGLHSDANNASNEDTRAFLEEMFPDDPGRVKKTMSQDRVPVSQALAELQARDLHTRTPDDFTAKTTDPFDAMLDDIIATGRNADHVEKLAFGHAKIQHRRVYRNLLRKYGKAETQAERNSLAQKIDSVREVSEKIAEANAKAQRAWGLAGRYSQFFLDKDLTLVEALAKAKVDKGGLELSKAQRDFIEREYAASDKLEARATPMRQGAVKKMRALSRVIRRLEGKASPTKRDAKLLKEAKKRYDRAEGVVVVADHDIRAAKSIRLNAVDKSQAGVILSPAASNAVQDVFDASRALRSSGEDSALGRQGMNLLARSLFTKEQAWIKTIPPALKMLAAAVVNNPAGRASARRLQQGLVDQPYQAVFDLAGGEIADVEGVGGRHGGTLDAKQEEFATNLFNRLGGFGRAVGERLIEPSQNAYALTLNMLRRDYFDRALKKRLTEAGIPADLSATELVKAVKADPQLLADLESDAYMTNVFTGRGDWRVGTGGRAKGEGAKDIAGVLARRLLYAPKYMASIVENALRTIPSAALTGLLTRRSWTKPLNYKNYPEWFKKIKDREYDPKVLPLVMSGVGPFKDVSDYQRGRLVGEAVFETAWLGSLAALAMIGLGDDEDEVSWRERLRRFNDPESADYRKLVIGNWHISLEGGRGATIRHLMPYGLSKSEADDMAAMDFDVDYSRRIGRMLRNKLHPFVSPLVGVLSNEDYLGEPLTDQEYEEAKDNAYDMLVHLGQRSIPIALAFTPIIAESMGEALGEGMAETGIPGLVPPDPSMADPDAPNLLNRLLITGGTNMFGIGSQYYDPESGDANLPPELRRLLRRANPAAQLRLPTVP